MAIELDQYGFRVGSNLSIIAEKGKEWFESASNSDVMEIIGCAAGYASNLRRDVAEKTGWTIAGSKGERKARVSGTVKNVKIHGCLPFKVMVRISKILDLDMEEVDIGWPEFLAACEADVDFEGFSMVKLAGGPDSDGGKSYQAWIDSNRANDAALKLAAEQAADPMFRANVKITSQSIEIKALKTELESLKAELETAKRNQGGRGVQRGGDLDQSMLRLMKQRFHPDRNNGDQETATKVMQWLNAIVL